jgi:very-short-patch-repair endonuclease/predicted transcriptional regulator of viral defense system
VVDDGCAYGHPQANHSPDEALADLAGRQHGVVSVAQLRELGFSKYAVRRRLERKRLLRLHTGVYAVGHMGLTVDSRRMAAVLACGRGALLSYRAAGALQALLPSSPQFDVTVPGGAGRSRPGVVVHRSRCIDDEDRDTVRCIPVTSVARTLVDLADVLDEKRLAKAIKEAEIQRTLDLIAIERVLARMSGRAGRHKLARILLAYRPDPHFTRSEAERRLLALCKRHGLPAPAMNSWAGGHEVDAYWPDVGVAVEVDGAQTHTTREAFQRDRERDRALATQGVRVVRITWLDIQDDARLAAELKAIRDAAGPAAGSRSAPACA